MKKRKFPLEKISKYRSYLEDEQAIRFKEATNFERSVENWLNDHNAQLDKKYQQRDETINCERLDIHRLKALQEHVLFAELDKKVLERELLKASDRRERERLNWLRRKSESDIMEKLEDRYMENVRKENLVEEQKEVDELARQIYLRKENS
jgi:flagellar FliJ protein